MAARLKKSDDIEAYMQKLVHARKDDIGLLRAVVQGAEAKLTERVKWNAPSFCLDGDDRITFRLQPGDRVELIFHRGAKVRGDASDFEFEDPSDLVRWVSNDRGVISFESASDIKRSERKLRALVRAWLKATTGIAPKGRH